MKEEERKLGSTRSIDCKRSEPKMTTSLDLEEDRGLNPQAAIVPIVEHSQEHSQPNLSKNYQADDVFHDEVELDHETMHKEEELPERALSNKVYMVF